MSQSYNILSQMQRKASKYHGLHSAKPHETLTNVAMFSLLKK